MTPESARSNGNGVATGLSRESHSLKRRNGLAGIASDVHALAAVLLQLAPGARGELLTTAEMAGRLGITSKTLLRRKSKDKLRPALAKGKLIRWRGDEMAQ